MEKNKNTIQVINFNKGYKQPTNKYNKARGFVEWGDKNDYPQFLLDLYNTNGHSIHKSIINRKVDLMTGKGLADAINPELQKFIDENGLESELVKIALDYEIFGGFCFEIIYSNDGSTITDFQHINFHKVRIGIKSEKINFDHFWFSKDWKQYKKDEYAPELIRAYNPYIRSGKQLVWYSEYNPASDGLYPIAFYSAAINDIQTGAEISKYNLNQVLKGFFPQAIMNFATGIPEEEEREENARQFEENFMGTEGDSVLLTYSEGQDQAPNLTILPTSDSDKKFKEMRETLTENIVTATGLPVQLILMVPGKLGSTEEREALMAELKETYIRPHQQKILAVVNGVLYPIFKEEIRFEEEEVVVQDNTIKEAQAQLKGSVGGVTSLLQIQTSVAQGITSRSSAIATIELIYGFTNEEANRLLGDVTEGAIPNPAQQAQLNALKSKFNTEEHFKKWRSKTDSSNVNRMVYDDETNQLVVKFNDGDIYTYFDVDYVLFYSIVEGNADCVTEGSNEYGEWYIGKNPSVGAALYQYLVDNNIRYEKGGNLK